jgi:CRP-like cAMP-binding protein
MQPDTARVLERVRKLLALATSSNVHEAALAASRAQALIDRHRLQRLLDTDDQLAESEPITDGRDDPLVEARRIRKWKSVLAQALAQLNGCIAYTDKRGKMKRIVVAGTVEDRAAVAALWEGLVRRIEWLSATHLDGDGQDKRWHDAFRIGAVQTIAARLKESRHNSTATLQTTAVTVAARGLQRRARRVEQFAQDNLRLKAGRGMRIDAEAYAEGKAAGAKMPLPEP